MDTNILMFVLIGVGAVLIAGLKIYSTMRKQDALKTTVRSVSDFTPDHEFVGVDGNSSIAVDSTRGRVCLVDQGSGAAGSLGASLIALSGPGHSTAGMSHGKTRVVTYRDLLAVEICEDGEAVTKTVRSSQIGGALVGGIALGGVGLLLGGLTGKRITKQNVKRIDLRLIVNDVSAPTHSVNFLNNETKQGSFLYKQAIEKARHWHALVEVLIKRADSEDARQAGAGSSSPVEARSIPIADELKKLAQLRADGVLTDEEFQAQKKKLLI